MATKELYLAKSFAELNDMADIGVEKLKTNTSNAKRLIQTISRLEKEAVLCLKERDDEKAYILLYRFISSLTFLKTIPDFVNEKEYFNKLYNNKKVHDLMVKLEQVTEILKERYKLKFPERSEEALLAKLKRNKDDVTKTPPANGLRKDLVPDKLSDSTINNNKPDLKPPTAEEDGTITAQSLKNLIEQKCTRFLVIDCRSLSSYGSSHLDHSNCISIPDEILTKGSSAFKISEKLQLKNLDMRNYDLWNKRETFDNIILYDWNSSFDTRNPDSPISVLYDAMVIWDIDRKYKRKPQIVRGGFREISFTYPTLLTNPCTQDDMNKMSEYSSLKCPDLDLISYPPIDEDDDYTRKTPSQVSTQQNNIPNGPPSSTRIIPISIESDSKVFPDRSTKPRVSSRTNITPKESESVAPTKDDTPSPSQSNLQAKKPENVTEPKSMQPMNQVTLNISDEKKILQEPGKTESSSTVRLIPIRKHDDDDDEAVTDKIIPDRSKKPIKTQPRPGLAVNGYSAHSHNQQLDDDTISEKTRKGTMKRSQSIPNMSKMIDENEPITPMEDHNPPTFQRNLKPLQSRNSLEAYAARRRDFQAVRSTQFAITGLKNLGNTCYINSVLQCMFSTPHLVEYFRTGAYKHDISYKGKTNGRTTEEFAAVVREVNVGHRSISLNDFTSATSSLIPKARFGDQQDSHEFLLHLMECLHEELNRVKSKSPAKEQNNDNLSDAMAAKIAYQNFKMSDDSILVDLFWGQQMSCVTCLACSKRSVTFEQFNMLSVSIPPDVRKCDIRDCIDLFTSEERIQGFKCDGCGRVANAVKKTDLWSLPTYLIIHFKRFYNNGFLKKKMTEIDYPLEGLDLSQYVVNRASSHVVFDLYGVSNHVGSLEGGHYTASCKRQGKWYDFDDAVVKLLSRKQDIVKQNSYIVFYQSREA